jgi:hypothetical protein
MKMVEAFWLNSWRRKKGRGKLPAFLKKIAGELGLKLAQKVEHTEDPSLKPTEKEGISIAGGITTS